MFAGSVDLVLGVLCAALLVVLGVVDVERWSQPAGGLPIFEHVAVELYTTRAETLRDWLTLWVPFVAYHTLTGLLRRPTLGAALTGLSVVGPDGHAASALRGLIRGLGYLLWPATGLLAPCWVFVSPSQRGLHDLIARTWVVRDPARLHVRSPE